MLATYSDVFRPATRPHKTIYNLSLVLAGSLLLTISAHIVLTLPFSPVPVTAQTFAVLILAMMLGRKLGVATILAYLTQGMLGLPVFARGLAGPAVLLGPTGGYLAGFVVAAYVVGAMAERGWDRSMGATLLAMLIGNSIIYLFGVAWLAVLVGMPAAISAGLLPFIPGDLIKTLLATLFLPQGWKLINHLRH